MPRICAVYALGLYVDVPAARNALRRYCNKAPDSLARDQGFYDGAPSQFLALSNAAANCSQTLCAGANQMLVNGLSLHLA